MTYYNELIDETIRMHNEKIYGELNTFLMNTSHKLSAIAAQIVESKAMCAERTRGQIQKD